MTEHTPHSPDSIRAEFLEQVFQCWNEATDEQRAAAIERTAARVEKLQVRINGESVPVHKIVDIDPDDNRVYVQTFAGSETFCLPIDAVSVVVTA